MNESKAFSYDVVPYASDTHKTTRPDHLATVAQFFGLRAPDFRNSRVLELGCAGGGNLIPMAAAYPESRFIGIDLSENHIAEGEKSVAEIGLNNIDLRCLSITDVDESFGIFDYIIAHGVYAWVPEQVRDKIFAICKENLSHNGLAYVSYNTLPGWNMVKTVRDMMIYHTEQFDEPAAKVREARRMIEFAVNNSVASDSGYKQILEREATMIGEGSDDYLYHDHLAQYNTSCYFHEFMEKATKEGLQYLGDCSLPSMYLGNFALQAREILGQIDDIVRQEQYLDFLTNRRFRNTILCHAELPLNRNVSPDRLETLYFSTTLRPKEGVENVNLSVDEKTEFVHPTSATGFVANNRVLTALFCVLAEQPGLPTSLGELAAQACARLSDVTEVAVRQMFLDNGVTLVLSGALEVASDQGCHTTEITARPEVWPCARYISRSKMRVPNVLHDAYELSDDLRAMVLYADGTRTIEEITDSLLQHFIKGELSFRLNGKLIADEPTLAPLLKRHVQAMLKFLADRAFLVA